MESLFRKLGVHIPEILLPAKSTDLTKWSVIACDQYTSQPDYWQRVHEEVDGSPSTLKLTLPEIYLKDDEKDTRINNINQTMQQYVTQSILEPQKPGFILVDRSTPHAASRKGLILAVDLECYDYRAGSQTLIRATEGTVLDRIPPRVKIRENAPIELPHIMLLIDDPEKTVIEELFKKVENFEKLYDFELMQGGGHVRGWKVEDTVSLSMIAAALAKLADPAAFAQKYVLHENTKHGDGSPKGVLLFAAGDGNHSLASAKAHWENVRASLSPEAAAAHPARFALVEVVNVHDEGLVFEPIHRVLFGIDRPTVLDSIKNICSRKSNAQYSADYKLYDSRASMEAALDSMSCPDGMNNVDNFFNSISTTNRKNKHQKIHLLPFILEGTYGLIAVYNPSCSLEAGTLQAFIDELLKSSKSIEADYIHGDQVVTELGSQKDCMGFYLPAMDKHGLFRTVILDGVLPRKTFSMGEAEEKRYYLECRRIS